MWREMKKRIVVMAGFSAIATSSRALVAQSDVSALSSITTDTGDFAVGQRDFSRFKAPWTCVGAISVAEAIADRSVEHQMRVVTTFGNSLSDSVPASVIAVARSCGAKFSVANTSREDLLDLFQVALISGNDTMASAIIRRFIPSGRIDTAHAGLIDSVVVGYLRARPARIADAEAFLKRMEPQIPSQKRSWILPAWSRLIGFEASRPIVDRPRLRVSVEHVMTYAGSQYGDTNATNWWKTVLAQANSGAPEIHPTPVPALEAAQWIPSKPNSSHTPTLVVSMGGPWNLFPLPDPALHTWSIWDPNLCVQNRDYVVGPLPFPSDVCIGLQAWLTEWTRRYQPQELSIIIVEIQHGSTLWSEPLNERQEAERLASYFRDHLKLPVTVALVPITKTQLPEPDGRHVCKDGDCLRLLSKPQLDYLGPPVSVLDANGQLVYRGDITLEFNDILERVVHPPGKVAPAPSSSSQGQTQ